MLYAMNRTIQLIFAMVAALCLLGGVSGCGKSHTAPPTERNSLILRFFESMSRGDAAAASVQGGKLRAMDPANDYIVELVTIQQSNAFLQKAQGEINAGNINRALEILNAGVKTYPSNRELSRQRGRVRQLRHAKALLSEMEQAKNSAAMSAAMTAAATGLSSNMTPKLREYFKRYRRRIDETARQEAARAAAPEPSVKSAVPAPPPVPGK